MSQDWHIQDLIDDEGIAAYVEGRDAFLKFLVASEALDEMVIAQDLSWRVSVRGVSRGQILTGEELLALIESTEQAVSVSPLGDLVDLPYGARELAAALSSVLEMRSGYVFMKFPDSWTDLIYREYLDLIDYPLEDSFK